MHIRILLARFIIKLGNYISSLAVSVMRPDDILEYNRRAYINSTPQNLEVYSGLNASEEYLLDKIPIKSGKFLILGVGSGREAIALSQKGFEVTGVDFIPELVEASISNAEKYGLSINGLTGGFTCLNLPKSSFDIIFISTGMYSTIPTTGMRIRMLKDCRDILVRGGYFICRFHHNIVNPGRFWFIKKALAIITLGNIGLQKGDMLQHNLEFVHSYDSEAEVKIEFEAAGFKVDYLDVSKESRFGDAILRKL